jgi:archaellum component FlaC
MVKEKVMLAFTDEALGIINANASERKRGEWVSKVVTDYNRIMSGVGDSGDENSGLLERIDNRLAKIEKQLAVLIANQTQ